MNESAFRSLFHKAIGEPEVPEYLRHRARLALEQSTAIKPSRLREGLAVLAVVVAIVAVVVVTMLGPRMFTPVQQTIGVSSPSPSMSPVATSPPPDPSACRLPIVIEDDSSTGKAPKFTAGFIDVATGKFSGERISYADLPAGSVQVAKFSQLGQYDPAVSRWLPGNVVVSPDQLSYVYPTEGSSGSHAVRYELHIYDLVQHRDRILWTLDATFGASRWTADGIYVASESVASSNVRYWRIDPASGRATEINRNTFDPYRSLLSGPGSFGVSGAPGQALYTIGSREPGTRYTDFVIIDGKRKDIYSGVNGDRMDFDPLNVFYDGPRLWFSNYDSKVLWNWTAATGLTRYALHGIPNGPGSDMHPVVYRIAGPCA